MVDWTDYKGLTPWSAEHRDKLFYNIGSETASFLNPTWSVEDFTGVPDPDTHRPCGYWWKEPAYSPGPPEPTFSDPDYVSGGAVDVCWFDDGSALGLFYRIDIWNSNVTVSADGGETWSTSLHWINDTGINAGYGRGISVINNTVYALSGAAVAKLDGSIWTVVFEYSVTGQYPDTIAYHAGIYILATYKSGGLSKLYLSTDGETFTFQQNISLYTYYPGNIYYNGKHYLFGRNYNHAWVSDDLITWTVYDTSGGPFNLITSARGECYIGPKGLLYYSQCTFNGSIWSSMPQAFTYGDYKATIGIITTIGETMSYSFSGSDWTLVVDTKNNPYGIRRQNLYGCCIGRDRWMAVGQYGTIFQAVTTL